MAKYIIQMRRGTKDDWKNYENSDVLGATPRAGELVVEYDEDNNNLPRLKIGDGVRTFSKLPYVTIDSFVFPKTASVTLKAASWKQDENSENRFWQIPIINNASITENSKVDLQPTPSQLCVFHEKDIAFTAVTETDDDGNTRLVVYVVGQKPEVDHTINITITEVLING